MISFHLFNFKTPQAVPARFLMTNWIYAANDDVMYSKPKKF